MTGVQAARLGLLVCLSSGWLACTIDILAEQHVNKYGHMDKRKVVNFQYTTDAMSTQPTKVVWHATEQGWLA